MPQTTAVLSPPRRPRRWAALLATLVVAGVTARLGWWQLDRAQQKLALQAQISARQAQPPLASAELPRDAAAAAALLHRRVRVEGRWLSVHTVYLDNRPMQGRAGFEVLTPLALDDGSALLVQRGWVARDPADRTHIAAPPPPPGRAVVAGRIAASASRVVELGSSGAPGSIRQNLDLGAYARETGLPLRPVLVVQQDGADAATDGLLRHWPEPAADVARHHGYAFQWFALAALAVSLYVGFEIIGPARRRAGRRSGA